MKFDIIVIVGIFILLLIAGGLIYLDYTRHRLTNKQKEGITFCVHHDPSLQVEYDICIDELVG